MRIVIGSDWSGLGRGRRVRWRKERTRRNGSGRGKNVCTLEVDCIVLG